MEMSAERYLLAHNCELVVLELFKGFLTSEVSDDTRGVNHAGTEEPFIEIVTS